MEKTITQLTLRTVCKYNTIQIVQYKWCANNSMQQQHRHMSLSLRHVCVC